MARDGKFSYGQVIDGVTITKPFHLDDDKLPIDPV